MLSNFIVCVEAVLPIFILLVIGVLVRKAKVAGDKEIKVFNHLVFVVCFPAMMFENLYGAKIEEAFNLKLVLFAVGSLMLIYFLSIPIVMKLEKKQTSRGAMIQAIYRSNFVILGLPITMNIYGKGNLAVTAMLIAIIVPLYNVLAVITLESFRKGKINPWHIIKGVLKNPLILGAVAGMFFVLTGLRLPHLVEGVVSDLGGTATTMALIVLGASFDFSSIRRSGRNLWICVMARLVLIPGIFLTAAAMLGIQGIAFVSLVAMFAAPTAISSYTMAVSMDSDGELAGNCVIFSSLFACFTMFLWLFIFKNLGIF